MDASHFRVKFLKKISLTCLKISFCFAYSYSICHNKEEYSFAKMYFGNHQAKAKIPLIDLTSISIAAFLTLEKVKLSSVLF